mgnify:FL=1
MGLVQNLKKRLGRWAEKILVELSYHYIVQKAKQTTKKQDNYLLTKSLPNNLTMGHPHTTIVTSSHDTSEKTIMELNTTEDIVAYVREWAIDKIEESELCGDKIALYAEFGDWIDMEEEDDCEIISLEPDT